MLQHLELLFGRALGGRIEITGIHTDDQVRPRTRTRFFDVGELEAVADFAAEINAEPGRNVYVGAALRNDDVFPGNAADDADFLKAYAVWADADDQAQLDAARAAYRALEITPPFIVVTGRTPTTRAQMWWPLEAPVDDIDTLRGLLRGIATALKTDPKVCTGKQLMRLAGTVNWPKKDDRVLERTEIVLPRNAAREFPIERLERAFPPIARFAPGGAIQDVEIGHGGALGLDEKVMDGRESYAFRLVRAHLREWIGTTGSEPTPDELYKDVAPVYLAKADQVRPGRGPEFLKQKVIDALRAYHAGQIPGMASLEEAVQTWAEKGRRADPVPFEDHDGDEAASSPGSFAPGGFDGSVPPPRQWAYANILMFKAVTGIAAPPGVGKTTFSFQVSLAYALDRAFGLWEPAIGGGGRVWLYNGEEPKDELDRRFLAACAEMGVQPSEAARRVAYNSGLDERLTLVRQDAKSGELRRSPDVDLIKARIRENQFTLFVVDPLIEFHGAKEDTEGFHAIGSVLREIAHDCNCAVLFFHHTPKAANSDTAAGDMNAMRGGGPIIGVARFVATMFGMTAKDAEEYGVSVKERARYVRFDDAKANMTLVSTEPQWWMKLGICIDNADDIRPADNIGVLRFQRLRGSSEPAGIEQTLARANARQMTLDRIASEMVRVCSANGHTSPETAASFDGLFRALDPIKTGVSVNTAKEMAMSEMGSGREIHGAKLIISTVPRGKLTIRKVHVEGEPDAS